MNDDRAKLRRADALLRNGEHEDAARIYAEVGCLFRRQGLLLKAVAVWKQVHELLHREAFVPSDLGAEARGELIALYRELGLEADARAIEMELQRELH